MVPWPATHNMRLRTVQRRNSLLQRFGMRLERWRERDRDGRERVADVATFLVVVVALFFAGWTVWDRFHRMGSKAGIPTEDREIAEWTEVASDGHRIGPGEAQVLIVAFEDHECPFCRKVEGPLTVVREEYPEEVAVIHRHLPLSIHDGAYRAARMAECGAEQERFEAVHRVLFTIGELMTVDASAVAEAASVPDVVGFAECANRTDPVPRIEEDLELAQRLGINAVPAIIFEGTLLAPPPDSLKLINLVRSILLRREAAQSASEMLPASGGE